MRAWLVNRNSSLISPFRGIRLFRAAGCRLPNFAWIMLMTICAIAMVCMSLASRLHLASADMGVDDAGRHASPGAAAQPGLRFRGHVPSEHGVAVGYFALDVNHSFPETPGLLQRTRWSQSIHKRSCWEVAREVPEPYTEQYQPQRGRPQVQRGQSVDQAPAACDAPHGCARRAAPVLSRRRFRRDGVVSGPTNAGRRPLPPRTCPAASPARHGTGRAASRVATTRRCPFTCATAKAATIAPLCCATRCWRGDCTRTRPAGRAGRGGARARAIRVRV